MNAQLRVFVSSVQKEFEDERLIVQNLINTDAYRDFDLLLKLDLARKEGQGRSTRYVLAAEPNRQAIVR